MDAETLIKEGPHKYFGIELNQLTWSLLTKPERTTEEDEMMLHAAHGSYFHWLHKDAGATNANKQRGEWLLSHVYAALNIPERAMHYAKRCRDINDSFDQEMEDFDLAYADEVLARAYACSGNRDECIKFYNSAREKGEMISDKESKEIFEGDLKSGPWFGMI